MILFFINAFVFGMSTKFADLLDEHGLVWFKGADILFGFIWGILFCFQLFDNIFASFYLALLFHWIVRGKIDYPNHRIATIIILITTLFILPELDWLLFGVIFFVFISMGLLNDNNLMRKIVFSKYNLFVILVLVLLSLLVNNLYWLVLLSFILNSLGYQLVKKVWQNIVLSL